MSFHFEKSYKIVPCVAAADHDGDDVVESGVVGNLAAVVLLVMYINTATSTYRHIYAYEYSE